MSTDYQSLVQDLIDAVQSVKGALPGTDNPSDLAQAHEHLGTTTDLLWDIDQDNPEAPGEDAALSQAAAIAQNVSDHLLDMSASDGLADQLTALDQALDAVRAAGYRAPDPGDLKWYEGDEPTDGSDF